MTEAFSGSSTCVQTLKHYYASIDASLCSEPTPPPPKKKIAFIVRFFSCLKMRLQRDLPWFPLEKLTRVCWILN